MRNALLCLLMLGCAPDEPAWQEGELGEWQPGLTVSGAGGCSTFILDGLSKQLIAEQNCIRPNALVSFKGAAGISLGSSVYPYLEGKAHDGLVAAAKSLTLDVNSAFRTLAQQYLLYRWYQNGQCSISLAAVPGNSNHETGIAVDLSNYSAALTAMRNHGFTHSYPSSDPVHYDYTAGGTVDLRNESVLAFQKLWNLNNPGDKIAEDGDYGPQTAARIAKSPVDGFAKGSTCTPQSNPTPSNPPTNPPPSMPPSNPPSMPPDPSTPPDSSTPDPVTPQWNAEFVERGGPGYLAADRSADVWIDFKNTGTAAWTPGKTFLGTVGPRDRMSDLAGPGWMSANRPATVDKVTMPGETGRFAFTIIAPGKSSAVAEDFGLVEEGVSWFANVQYTFELEVEDVPGQKTFATKANGSDVGSGCNVGGAPDAGLLTFVILGFVYGRRRRRDVA